MFLMYYLMGGKFAQVSLSDFNDLDMDAQVVTLCRMIVEVNDECFRRKGIGSRKKVSWWTNELAYKRGRFRTLRKKFKDAKI